MKAFSLIHANRLRKLARHLRRGKLAHKKFDFANVNIDKNGEYLFTHCGTAGCALGEFHVVFPGEFAGIFWVGADDVTNFLGISIDESEHLFLPRAQLFGRQLSSSSTRFQVAENMIAFLKTKGFEYAD